MQDEPGKFPTYTGQANKTNSSCKGQVDRNCSAPLTTQADIFPCFTNQVDRNSLPTPTNLTEIPLLHKPSWQKLSCFTGQDDRINSPVSQGMMTKIPIVSKAKLTEIPQLQKNLIFHISESTIIPLLHMPRWQKLPCFTGQADRNFSRQCNLLQPLRTPL